MNTVSVDRELLEEVEDVLRECAGFLPGNDGGIKRIAEAGRKLTAALAQPEQPEAVQPISDAADAIAYAITGEPDPLKRKQPEAGRGVCSRCHGVDGDCDALMSDDPTACPCRCHEPQVQDESHRICGCEECRGPTPYEAEHPSEGNVGRYYGEAVGANTWDIYRPDGSFLAHIDRPGVFYAILDELNKLNATTRPQVQEAGREYECAECDVALEKRNQFRYFHPHNGCRLAGSWAIGEIHDVRKGGDETIIRLARTSRPQPQEAAAIGWLRLHNGQPDWDECCIFETREAAERYLDSRNLDPEERQEYSHAQIYLAPPANAEAVRIVSALRSLWRTKDGALVLCNASVSTIEAACREADTFLAQHGGRGDE